MCIRDRDNSLQIAKREYLPSVSGNINNNATFGQGRDIFGNSNRNDNFSNSANVGADILVFNNGRLEKNIRKTAVSYTHLDVYKRQSDYLWFTL